MATPQLIHCRYCGSDEQHYYTCGDPRFAVPDDAPAPPEGQTWRHEELVDEHELTGWNLEPGDVSAERFRDFVLVRTHSGQGSIADGRLPLPIDLGGPELPFARAVDAYIATHGGTKKACYEAIAAITGNSPKGIALRYSQRGDRVWLFASPL
jgi:hypothetical protein